jgi:hypothetical protein
MRLTMPKKRRRKHRYQGIVSCIVFDPKTCIDGERHQDFHDWLEDRLIEYFGVEALDGYGTTVVTAKSHDKLMDRYLPGED